MNGALQIALLWPLSIVVCALLSMLVWATFSWSELIFNYIVGVVIGAITVAAFTPGASPVVRLLLIPSHGLLGLLAYLGVDAFKDPATFFWATSGTVLAATLLGAALDHAAVAIGPEPGPGSIILGIFMAPLKLAYAPLTTGVGFLFFLVGVVRALASKHCSVGFSGGIFYVQWDDAAGDASATTLGGTIQVWSGQLARLFKHELYHTRQYVYMRDWMIPGWLLGGVWGLISSAIADPAVVASCYFAARPGQKGIGNPIEAAAYNISGGANC